MEAVLRDIPDGIPDIFRAQARTAAEYISALGENPEAARKNPAIARFVEQLQESEFYYHAFEKNHPGIPAWLEPPPKAPGAQQQFTENQVRIENLFTTECNRRYGLPSVEEHGDYYDIPAAKTDNVAYPHYYKMYLGTKTLLTALENGNLWKWLEDLQQKNIAPSSFKLHDRFSLVLYFSRDASDESEIQEIRTSAEAYGIKLRGPAQDVEFIKVKEGSTPPQIEFNERIVSNDTALKSRGRFFSLTEYDPAKFLQEHLLLCMSFGKRPDVPYMTSFSIFEDWDENLTPDQLAGLMPQAEAMAQYPVCPVVHRVDLRGGHKNPVRQIPASMKR